MNCRVKDPSIGCTVISNCFFDSGFIFNCRIYSLSRCRRFYTGYSFAVITAASFTNSTTVCTAIIIVLFSVRAGAEKKCWFYL